ncbi:MAG: LysM peptidoglycan-binding domain-containing protein [Rhodobacteraceae bacterium]|nr:LysM peptidoglycan-binding domain-containing protein [Paracoccaceae bacterium]
MGKLSFQRIDAKGTPYGDTLSVQFNPTELSFAKTAQFADIAIPGLPMTISQFVRGNAETLSLELLFDGTEGGMGEDTPGVTEDVNQFHKFVQIDGDRHAPPLVRISWGAHFPGNAYANGMEPEGHFDAQVLSVGRKFTLFAPDGAPLRAVVSLSLKEYVSLSQQIAKVNYRSPDHTRTHVVQEGETLPLIAHEAYGDGRKWRVIADHNGIADIRSIAPGTVLSLPPTTGPMGAR